MSSEHASLAALTEMCLAGEWPELLPFLFRWSKSENPNQRESALIIFSQFCAMMGA